MTDDEFDQMMSISQAIENLHNISFENHLRDLECPQTLRKMKLSFARVGVFNPRTLLEYSRVLDRMRQGIPPAGNEYWEIDQSFDHPMVIYRVKTKNNITNRKNWRSKSVYGPLKLTPHAIARYRERTGYNFNPECVWDIAYIPDPIGVSEAGQIHNRMILPVPGGIMLGYTAITAAIGEGWRYNRGTLKSVKSETKPLYKNFYGITFVDQNRLTWDQITITEAYEQGDYERYNALVKENCEKQEQKG